MTVGQKSALLVIPSLLIMMAYYVWGLMGIADEGALTIAAVRMHMILTTVGFIVLMIVSHIILGIFHHDEIEIEDERDKNITLFVGRDAGAIHAVVIFVSMVALLIGQSAFVVLHILWFGSFTAEFIGAGSRLFRYARGA